MERGDAPARRDRWPNCGVVALVVAAGGLVTGVFLAFNYAPTLDAARDSVQYIQTEVTLGWLPRGLHHWAGNLALVLAAVGLAIVIALFRLRESTDVDELNLMKW